MKIINLLLLFFLAMIAKAQNVSVEQDSTSIPDLQEDMFVILTVDSVVYDTLSYGREKYMIKSSAVYPQEGIFRYEVCFPASPHPNIRMCGYEVRSTLWNVEIAFRYYLELDRVSEEIKPHLKTRILTMPREFLERIKPIDLNEEYPRLRNEEDAKKFKNKFRRKWVWVIDRQTMTDSSITLIRTSF